MISFGSVVTRATKKKKQKKFHFKKRSKEGGKENKKKMLLAYYNANINGKRNVFFFSFSLEKPETSIQQMGEQITKYQEKMRF